MRGQAFMVFVLIMALIVSGVAISSLTNLGQKFRSMGKQEYFVQALLLADTGIQQNLFNVSSCSPPCTYGPTTVDAVNSGTGLQDSSQPAGSYTATAGYTCSPGSNCACAAANYTCPSGATCTCYTIVSTGYAVNLAGVQYLISNPNTQPPPNDVTAERGVSAVVVSQTNPYQLFINSWQETKYAPYQ